jgi:hypothetical protein
MTWFLALLGASVFSSILVLAAGILSSRMNRGEDYVENFYMEAVDVTGSASQATE